MFKSLSQIREGRDYRNFRWFYTNDGKLVVGGKNEDQNELVLRNFLKPDYVVMHTSKPGSPFMIIQDDKPSNGDLDETAVYCASFSQQWKTGDKKVDIDIFKGSQLYKDKNMKIGTFGINGKKENKKVKPELVLVIQKGKLRAVPKIKRDEEILADIKPGKLTKDEAVDKIAKKIKDKFNLPISKDEIMQAIPSGNINVK